jgi:histidinol dehydrogenase
VFLLSESAELLEAVSAAVDRQLETLPRREIASKALEVSRLVQVRDLQEAIDISNDYAPEHLILALRAPREWVDRIQSAGTVFMGDWTPESLGDYCSGSNHVLPTGGAARAWSGLSVASFMTSLTLQTATSTGIANIGPCAVTLAEAEGLEAHARAARLRLAALP